MKATRVFKLSVITLIMASGAVHAMTLDYRTEYKAGSETMAQRLKLSHTLDNGIFFGVEGKMAEGSDVDSQTGLKTGNSQWSGSGSEWELGKNFKINNKLTIAPAVNLDVQDAAIGYRGQVKFIYSINENWLTTFRWRAGIQKAEKPDVQDKNYNQFNWEFGYKSSDVSVVGDLEYRGTNYADYKGDHDYWLYNVVIAVPVTKNWVPYGEIGYIPRYNDQTTFSPAHSNDEMEMRYRIGIKYNF